MKLTIQAIKDKFKIMTTDGKQFSIEDVLFDDRNFEIIFFICSYGGILDTQRVLVSPLSIVEFDILKKTINVNLNSEHLKEGPSPNYKIPVSREYESIFLNYPMHPYFFGMESDAIWTGEQLTAQRKDFLEKKKVHGDKPNRTRSINEVESYYFSTADEDKGEISDWIVDTYNWSFIFISAGEGSLWKKQNHLLPTEKIEKISFIKREVILSIKSSDLKQFQNFDPQDQVNRNTEITNYDYWGRSKYTQSLIINQEKEYYKNREVS
jgi:uncharacterized protein YrrD